MASGEYAPLTISGESNVLERFNSLGVAAKTVIVAGPPAGLVAVLGDPKLAAQTFVAVAAIIILGFAWIWAQAKLILLTGKGNEEKLSARIRREIQKEADDALKARVDDLAERGKARDAKVSELQQIVENAGSTDALPTKLAIDITTHCEPPK